MLNLVGGSMGSSGSFGHPQQARLFVGDLKNAEKADIEAEFSTCGPIKEIWMAHNPPGFAFVEFIDRDSALKALKKMNGAIIKGDKLRVEFSKNRKGAGGFRGANNSNNASPFMNNGVGGPTACYYNPNRGGPIAPPPSAQAPPHYQYPPPFATAQASFAPGPMGGGRPPSPSLHLQPGPTLADYHHGAYAAATPMYAPYGVPQVEGSPIGGAPHYAATAAPNDYYQAAAAAAHLKSLQQQAPQGNAGAARMSIEEYDRYYRAAAAALSQQPPPPPTDPYGQPIPTATSALGGAPPAPSYLGGNGAPPLVNDYRDYYLATEAAQQHKRYPDEMGGSAPPPTHYAAHHLDPGMRASDDPYGGMRYKYRTEGQVSDDYERYLRSLYPPPPGAMGGGGPMHHPASSPNGAAPGGRKYSATSRYRTASPSPPPKGGGPIFRSGPGGAPGSSPTRPYSPGNNEGGGRGGGRRDESPPKYRYYDPYYDSYYRDYRHHGHGRPGSPPMGSGSSGKDLGGSVGPSAGGGGSIGSSKPATSAPGRGDIMGMVGGDAGNRGNAMGSSSGDGGKSSGPRQIKNGGVLVTNRRDTNEQRGGGNGDFYYDDKNNRTSLNIHDGQRR